MKCKMSDLQSVAVKLAVDFRRSRRLRSEEREVHFISLGGLRALPHEIKLTHR